MTFLQQLRLHKGGLICLKTHLYWYGSGYDKNPDRICLILDTAAAAPTAAAARGSANGFRTAALLLVDGSPHWIWVAEEDVELL
jgi:hypothetical protein